jgi:hypothetical protein
MQISINNRNYTENNNNKKLSMLQENNKQFYGMSLGFTKRRCTNNKRYCKIVNSTLVKRSKLADPKIKIAS